jgi:hypothetical protein
LDTYAACQLSVPNILVNRIVLSTRIYSKINQPHRQYTPGLRLEDGAELGGIELTGASIHETRFTRVLGSIGAPLGSFDEPEDGSDSELRDSESCRSDKTDNKNGSEDMANSESIVSVRFGHTYVIYMICSLGLLMVQAREEVGRPGTSFAQFTNVAGATRIKI